MLAANHKQIFRPLRGGIAIVAPRVNRFGTLGCIAFGDGGAWLVTAYHVLADRGRGDLAGGDPIHQLLPGMPPGVAARAVAGRADPGLDAAAGLLELGVEAVPEVLGLGRVAAAVEPAVGMRVVKSGAATGVTEGVIVGVQLERVEIESPPGFPSKYELSDVSDSGAVWLEMETRAAVGLHVGGNDVSVERAFAVPMPLVLATLGLSLTPPGG
jgi:hypothetical protein